MSKVDISVLPLPVNVVGEAIVWCERRRTLWWVDIGRSELLCHTPETGETNVWPMHAKIGCIALTESDALLVALGSGLHRFEPGDGSLIRIAGFPGMPEDHRPNDGAVSRAGRFYVGTTALGDRSRPSGALYCFDPAHGMRLVLEGLHVANGLAFSPDDRIAYLSDSWPDVRSIWCFDHEAVTGDLSNRQLFFDTHVTRGRPDGACVDSEGGYWMAGVGGGEVLRLSPDGEIDFRIEVPVLRPSKPCFGGPDLSTLYVTSIGLDAESDSMDGSLIAMDLPFTGLPESRIDLASLRSLR